MEDVFDPTRLAVRRHESGSEIERIVGRDGRTKPLLVTAEGKQAKPQYGLELWNPGRAISQDINRGDEALARYRIRRRGLEVTEHRIEIEMANIRLEIESDIRSAVAEVRNTL